MQVRCYSPSRACSARTLQIHFCNQGVSKAPGDPLFSKITHCTGWPACRVTYRLCSESVPPGDRPPPAGDAPGLFSLLPSSSSLPCQNASAASRDGRKRREHLGSQSINAVSAVEINELGQLMHQRSFSSIRMFHYFPSR